MFQRIAIVNRGEAAMRLIHAVRELNAERRDAEPIATIALYTDGERSAMFAREADEAHPLGPASERPYLNHELLARVLAPPPAGFAFSRESFPGEAGAARALLAEATSFDDAAFVERAYEVVLGRAADEEGFASAIRALAGGSITRTHLLRELLWSDELRSAPES